MCFRRFHHETCFMSDPWANLHAKLAHETNPRTEKAALIPILPFMHILLRIAYLLIVSTWTKGYYMHMTRTLTGAGINVGSFSGVSRLNLVLRVAGANICFDIRRTRRVSWRSRSSDAGSL